MRVDVKEALAERPHLRSGHTQTVRRASVGASRAARVAG
jgi:hypothetical protein